jgi:hypothetical protein
LTNIIAHTIDGAPSMTSRHVEFIAHLKKAVPGITCVHCVINLQHLAENNLCGVLHETFQFIVKVVNKIKANSLNDRIFRELCHDNGCLWSHVKMVQLIHILQISKGKATRLIF